jgi:hypothetical protein
MEGSSPVAEGFARTGGYSPCHRDCRASGLGADILGVHVSTYICKAAR